MGQFLTSIGNKIPTFVGIKFTSSNLDEGVEALQADNKKYVIFLGNDKVRISTRLFGGNFVFSFISI